MEFKIVAKTFQGLEELLAKELTELGANNIEIGNRMVSFTGDKEMLYRANFCLRTAVKVLKPIKEFKATDADEVYEVARNMEWSDYMDDKMTFLIDSVVFSENFRHSKFVAYRVKDAIADYFRDKTGERPNVSISNPDIRINVHISEDNVTISLDSSGESLHKRGYRVGTVPAPLNEVLAAALVMMSGWDCQCNLIDPFCGSGTILIEAALIAMNIYPGVFRDEFGFERWKDFDEDLFEKIYNDDSKERDFDYKIYGYDINRNAVATAIENAKAAGVIRVVDIQQQDFYEFEQPREKSIIITNPPYGERITTDDIIDLYKTIGSRLKQNFVGNDAWILSAHDECFAAIGFRPSTKIALYNSSIPCEFRKYQVFDGKLKDLREEGYDIKSDEERRRNARFKPHKMKDDSTFDGNSWRGEGSKDNEHYFKSRPDRKWGKGDDKGRRKPLVEGEDEPRLNRHNFKWGDRSANYQTSDYNQFDRDEMTEQRKSSHKPDRRPADGKGFGKGGKKGDKFRDSKKSGKRSHEENRRRHDSNAKSEKRNSKWGFDSEGRPFRRDDD